ncbi:ribosomal RNA small subunit methyltransferase A [Candidatus Peribacteria bacterium]|nr:ribosomal RNA small subunit methyltransferase A [Candidatus Peribacteria bacterium]
MQPAKKTAASRFAQKHLGQNFLQDPQYLEKILESVGDITGTRVLEIGPGLGALTSPLLEAGALLTAVEYDERAVRLLQERWGSHPQLQLVHGDALDFTPQDVWGEHPYEIIANIPYNITNPLLKRYLSGLQHPPYRLTLMVQREVAEKITLQRKHAGRRSILSISVEVYAESRLLFLVPREAFDPIPGVDSAVVQLTRRPTPLVAAADERDFFSLVHAGFSQKRKKLHNVLGSYFGRDSAAILGPIDGNLRAETLTIADWHTLLHSARQAGVF